MRKWKGRNRRKDGYVRVSFLLLCGQYCGWVGWLVIFSGKVGKVRESEWIGCPEGFSSFFYCEHCSEKTIVLLLLEASLVLMMMKLMKEISVEVVVAWWW